MYVYINICAETLPIYSRVNPYSNIKISVIENSHRGDHPKHHVNVNE